MNEQNYMSDRFVTEEGTTVTFVEEDFDLRKTYYMQMSDKEGRVQRIRFTINGAGQFVKSLREWIKQRSRE